MNQYTDKMKYLIAQSPLSLDEQQIFTSALSHADDSVLKPMTDLCSQDPVWIKKLYYNYKSKQAAIVADDPAMWDAIIQEEEKMLRDMAE